jgi:hypothetical protein
VKPVSCTIIPRSTDFSRLTGEHQVFAEGPDGLKLELLFETDKIFD